jgi:hypothetical protein
MRKDSSAQSARPVRLARDAEEAHGDYADAEQAVAERTARLREQRLARDAAQRAAPGETAKSMKSSRRPSAERPPHPSPTTRPGAIPSHLFLPGQRVKLVARAGDIRTPGGFYRVVTQLPADPTGNRYRVRSELEQHDRVVGEAQLSRISD